MKPIAPREVRVWDPAVRLFHWFLVVAFTAAYLSGDEWMSLHINAGYLIGVLLIFESCGASSGLAMPAFGTSSIRPGPCSPTCARPCASPRHGTWATTPRAGQ